MIRVTGRIFDDLVGKNLSVWYWKAIYENKFIVEVHLDKNYVYGFMVLSVYYLEPWQNNYDNMETRLWYTTYIDA